MSDTGMPCSANSTNQTKSAPLNSLMPNHHPNRRSYNWLVYSAVDQWLESSKALIRGDVVDLGAGVAPYRGFLTPLGSSYLTVDWALSQHQISADIIADLNGALPLESASADTVVSISVLEHLRRPEVFLAETSRILRSDGHLLLQVPWQWMVHEAPHDYFRYSPYALRMLLETANFMDISIRPSGGVFSTLALKLNYLLARVVRGPIPIQKLIAFTFWPAWCASQLAARWLDRLDRIPEREAPGYFVIARRRPR